jgi:signal transduction histidine kinase
VIRSHKNILHKSFEGSRRSVLRRTRLQRNEDSCVDGFVHLDVHGSSLRRNTQLRQRLQHLVIRELLVTQIRFTDAARNHRGSFRHREVALPQVRTRQLQRRNAEVLDQAGQLRELSGRLLRTQDDERRHIARELHDSAGQLISALGMNLAGINQNVGDNPTLAKALDDTQNLLQQLNKEIRTTSYLLHPPLLDDNGLRHAIEWYMEGLSERSDLKIDLDVSENFGRLPEDLELAIFRIVQEALTNIHRHSGSKTGTIRLSRDNGRVLLEIQDHGRGISVEKLAAIKAQRTGVGIAGMRERVLHLKGEMDIQSNDGGALVSVTLPLDPRSASATLPEAKAV